MGIKLFALSLLLINIAISNIRKKFCCLDSNLGWQGMKLPLYYADPS